MLESGCFVLSGSFGFLDELGKVNTAYRILWKARSLKAVSGFLKKNSQTLGLKYSM